MAASIARRNEDESAADQVGQIAAQRSRGPSASDIAFLEDTAAGLGITDFAIEAHGDRLVITGVARYELDRDIFWEALKEVDGWERDVVVDMTVTRTDARGYHTVEAGDSLASLAERYLGRASREMEIFEANRDRMNDPGQILPGQQLLIPSR